MKVGESYVSTRSQFLGTQSMLASTGTLIRLDVPTSKDERREDERELTIEGPNFPKQIKRYTRDTQGKFVEANEQEATGILNLECWLDTISDEELIKYTDLIKGSKRCGMSESQAERWIRKQYDAGRFEKVGKMYRIVKSRSN